MMQTRKTKTFDCLAFKDRVQQEIYEATKGMSREEVRQYLHDRVTTGPFAEFYARLKAQTRER